MTLNFLRGGRRPRELANSTKILNQGEVAEATVQGSRHSGKGGLENCSVWAFPKNRIEKAEQKLSCLRAGGSVWLHAQSHTVWTETLGLPRCSRDGADPTPSSTWDRVGPARDKLDTQGQWVATSRLGPLCLGAHFHYLLSIGNRPHKMSLRCILWLYEYELMSSGCYRRDHSENWSFYGQLRSNTEMCQHLSHTPKHIHNTRDLGR